MALNERLLSGAAPDWETIDGVDGLVAAGGGGAPSSVPRESLAPRERRFRVNLRFAADTRVLVPTLLLLGALRLAPWLLCLGAAALALCGLRLGGDALLGATVLVLGTLVWAWL